MQLQELSRDEIQVRSVHFDPLSSEIKFHIGKLTKEVVKLRENIIVLEHKNRILQAENQQYRIDEKFYLKLIKYLQANADADHEYFKQIIKNKDKMIGLQTQRQVMIIDETKQLRKNVLRLTNQNESLRSKVAFFEVRDNYAKTKIEQLQCQLNEHQFNNLTKVEPMKISSETRRAECYTSRSNHPEFKPQGQKKNISNHPEFKPQGQKKNIKQQTYCPKTTPKPRYQPKSSKSQNRRKSGC